MGSRLRWTAEEDQHVLAGLPRLDPELARELGRTVRAIRRRRSQLRRANRPPAVPEPPLVDRIPPHLAARLGLRLSDGG